MKYLKRTLIFAFLLLIIFLTYVEFGGRYILSHDDRRVITVTIRSTPELPQNFTSFYSIIYKNSLTKNSWNYNLKVLLGQNNISECPCREMAFRIFPSLDIKNKNSLDYFLVTRYLEQNYNQTDCLNFNFSNFDFLENRKGIEEVSKSLFDKDIKDLTSLEIAEVIALYENPVENNRIRYPDRALARTKYFHELYLKNLNKK